MAYTINRFSGSVLTTVADGTIDTTTDLTFIGKNYSGYGEILNENFVRLLENFSGSNQPSNPISGQLWWDTSNGQLKLFNGSTFKVVSGATSSASQPSGATAGDLWFNSSTAQLNVFNGASWVLIGPSFTAATGTSGALVETVTDSLGSNHVVVKIYVNEAVVATVSRDATFTPQSSIPGFSTIGPGLQLSSSVSNARFRGEATNAATLNNLSASQFLRSDTNDTTTGVVTISNDGGLVIGSDNDLTLTVNGSNTLLSNTTSNGDMILRVNRSSGGVTSALTIDGASAFVSLGQVPPSGDDSSRVASTSWVSDNSFLLDGSNSIVGDVLPGSNGTYNLGSPSFKWNNVHANTLNGTAVEALYADIAERFAADAHYDEGTVLEIGGEYEVTAVKEERSVEVFGVVSKNPAYLMNRDAGPDETHPKVAVAGRVPVKVVGPVTKGQRLISAGNGVAKGADSIEHGITSFMVIGRALENKDTEGLGLVMSVVRIN